MIVTAAAFTAVLDKPHNAAFLTLKLKQDVGGIAIAVTGGDVIDERYAACVHFGDVGIGKEADHIEVMNGHIEEDAAFTGDGDVVFWRHNGITRGDANLVQAADGVILQVVFSLCKSGIETAIEADEEFTVTGVDLLAGGEGVWDGEGEWFFAENVFMLRGGGGDEFGVGIGGAADKDDGNIGVGDGFKRVLNNGRTADGFCPGDEIIGLFDFCNGSNG